VRNVLLTGHRHASPAEGLQLQADGTKRLAMTNNGPLGEYYEPGKPVAHLALRVFEVHPGLLVAEFIAQPRGDRLHHLRVARIRFLLNVWILVLDPTLSTPIWERFDKAGKPLPQTDEGL
jgi:hypothetical protein